MNILSTFILSDDLFFDYETDGVCERDGFLELLLELEDDVEADFRRDVSLPTFFR